MARVLIIDDDFEIVSILTEILKIAGPTKETPILFMSGEADPAQIQKEISDSAGSRFLPKPVKLEEFRRTIREMLAPQEKTTDG
ncbi:MAG: response regulator [Elusimicrobia bacterium]|nr:response regulator [Elusimicrobiota bacterium]